MFQRVLFPLDGSERSEQILSWRSRLVAPGGESVLLRVAEEAEESVAEGYLEGLRQRLGEGAVSRIVQGDPADMILREVTQLHPDLVAMASHGRAGLERLVRGSVAERVLRHCPAPLLVATQAAEGGELAPLRRLLVPLDLSDRAARILPLIGGLAVEWQAAVTLLHVLPLPPPLPSPYFLEKEWSEERVQGLLEPHRAGLEERGLEARIEVRVGYAATEVLRASEEADLIAMASHGRSGPSRWWLGSVAEQVLRHCEIPLLLTREPKP